MQPIPETIELAHELSRELDRDFDVLRHLQGVADKVQAVVPDCVGLSIAWLDRDVAFTLVASDEEIALLDAVQYLAGGPCVEAGDAGGGTDREQGEGAAPSAQPSGGGWGHGATPGGTQSVGALTARDGPNGTYRHASGALRRSARPARPPTPAP